jgi:hypothetical protein
LDFGFLGFLGFLRFFRFFEIEPSGVRKKSSRVSGATREDFFRTPEGSISKNLKNLKKPKKPKKPKSKLPKS